jgi:hypothetical protein
MNTVLVFMSHDENCINNIIIVFLSIIYTTLLYFINVEIEYLINFLEKFGEFNKISGIRICNFLIIIISCPVLFDISGKIINDANTPRMRES